VYIHTIDLSAHSNVTIDLLLAGGLRVGKETKQIGSSAALLAQLQFIGPFVQWKVVWRREKCMNMGAPKKHQLSLYTAMSLLDAIRRSVTTAG
jgi:hypothetical protein